MLFRKLAFIATVIGVLFLGGCDNSSKTEQEANSKSNVIRVGVIGGEEEAVAEAAKEQAKKLYNLDVELVIFSDYIIPNQALNDKLIDVNTFQHKPFLDKQIEEYGYKIAYVGNTFVYPIASYSYKLKPLNATDAVGQGVIVKSPRNESYLIPTGATIAIPNDPTNLGRSLLLLQHEGLIKVDPTKGLLPTILDITENPHSYKIIELEAPMLPRALNDSTVDLAIINNAFAGQVDLAPGKDGIFVEDKESPYVNIIAAREDNKDSENVINFIRAYQTDIVAEKAKEVFKDGAVKGW